MGPWVSIIREKITRNTKESGLLHVRTNYRRFLFAATYWSKKLEYSAD